MEWTEVNLVPWATPVANFNCPSCSGQIALYPLRPSGETRQSGEVRCQSCNSFYSYQISSKIASSKDSLEQFNKLTAAKSIIDDQFYSFIQKSTKLMVKKK